MKKKQIEMSYLGKIAMQAEAKIRWFAKMMGAQGFGRLTIRIDAGEEMMKEEMEATGKSAWKAIVKDKMPCYRVPIVIQYGGAMQELALEVHLNENDRLHSMSLALEPNNCPILALHRWYGLCN